MARKKVIHLPPPSPTSKDEVRRFVASGRWQMSKEEYDAEIAIDEQEKRCGWWAENASFFARWKG